MGLRDYFRRRRERESALTPEVLASVNAAAAASQEATGAPPFKVEQLSYRELGRMQEAVMAAMKAHGVDPYHPDPKRFMDPELQRSIREAVDRSRSSGGD